MADISGSYDQDAEVSQYDRLPPFTDQRALIVESKVEDLKDNKGRCLVLTWRCDTGPLDGRLFWQRLNLWFTGPEKKDGEVVRIANSQFAAVRQATGKIAPHNSEELHHIPCLVTYGPQKNNPDFDEVKSVKPVAANGGAQQRSAPPASSASRSSSAPANGGGNAPWRKAG